MRRIVARPELRNRPIVLEESYRGGRRVAVCSAEAEALGIAAGMPLAEAISLVAPRGRSRRGELQVEPHDPAGDRQALERLAEWCWRFSPIVGVDQSPHAESLLLDVTGVARFAGGEGPLAGGIVNQFSRRGMPVQLALADTIGAAWAVAHFGQPPDSDLSDGDASDGGSARSSVLIVPPGKTLLALRPLPLKALRLSDDVVDLLGELGVTQIGRIELLPRADLTARFGVQLLTRFDQAVGRRPETLPALRIPVDFALEHSLEYPTSKRKVIESLLQGLLQRLGRTLAEQGRGVSRLVCRFDCWNEGNTDFDVNFDVGLFEPTAQADHLLGLVLTRLERMSFPGAVRSLQVEAVITAPLIARQGELFGDERRKRHRSPAELVDRLSSRLGRESVLGVRLSRDAQPELAYRYEPMIDPAGAKARTSRRRKTSRRRSTHDLPLRPLRLAPCPTPLATVALAPDGSPRRFRFDGRQHRVAQAWGPERIETGWWRSPGVRRDYYRVETTTGHRFWLYLRLGDGRWFLHGSFT